MAASYNELFGLGTYSEDASLEGWWKLQDDAASTSVADSSSAASGGSLNGGNNTADISVAGPTGYLSKALDFDGTADYVALNAEYSAGVTEFTLLAWLNPDGTSGARGHFGSFRTSGGNDGLQSYINNSSNTLRANLRQAGDVDVASDDGTAVSASSWSSTAICWDGSNIRRFVNGSATGTADVTSISAVGTCGFSSFIGGMSNSGSLAFPFDGQIAGVAFFSRALTSAEVAQWDAGPEPLNTVAPTLSGTETVGQTLSCTTGTWDSQSNGTLTYSYQWTRSDDGTGTNEADISGATSSTYTLVSADSGKYIRCRVRASNDGGFDSAEDTNTAFTGAIAAGGGGTTGTASITLGAATLASTGKVAIDGTASPTLGSLSLSSAASLGIIGTASNTLGSLTAACVGDLAIEGTASNTLGDATLSATGTSGSTGSLSATLGELTTTSTGELPIDGTHGGTLGELSSAATGELAIKGSATATLGAATLNASGTSAVTGSGSVSATLGSLSLSASATLTLEASVTAALAAATLSSQSSLSIEGSTTATLGTLTLASTGTEAVTTAGFIKIRNAVLRTGRATAILKTGRATATLVS